MNCVNTHETAQSMRKHSARTLQHKLEKLVKDALAKVAKMERGRKGQSRAGMARTRPA